MSHPIPKPDFVLTGTDGKQFDFRRETEGHLTLLFFGYTHCPDVCPVHLANIAAVLHRLGPEVQERVKVVFVTTDPARDSLPRLRQWLDAFDTDFIGLTGPLAQVNAIQQQLHLGAAYREAGPDSAYTVAHAAVVLAFTPDNLAHFMYPFGIRQSDWANDLPRLVETRGAPR